MTRAAGIDALDRDLLRVALAPDLGTGADSGARDRLADRLNRGGLAQLDGERRDVLGLLARAGGAPGATGDLVPRLAGVRRSIWLANQLRLATAARAVAGLREAGVACLLTDDLAVAGLLDDLAARPLQRLRLTIRPDHDAAARRGLERAGWRLRRPRRGVYLADPEATTWEDSAGESVEIARSLGADLTAARESGDRAGRGEDAIWSSAVRVELPTIGVAEALGIPHQLIRLAGDAIGWRPRPRLLRLADLVLVLHRATEADWGVFLAQVHRRDLVAACRERLDWLETAVPGSVPRTVLTSLLEMPASPRDRLAHLTGRASPALGRHIRASNRQHGPGLVAGLPSSLRHSWGLESAWQVAPVAIRHATARLLRRSSGAQLVGW